MIESKNRKDIIKELKEIGKQLRESKKQKKKLTLKLEELLYKEEQGENKLKDFKRNEMKKCFKCGIPVHICWRTCCKTSIHKRLVMQMI